MVSMKLLSLAEREYKQTRKKPAPASFKAININPGRFDERWDRRRGSAVRMMAVVLRENDEALRRRVGESPESLRTYESASSWFAREAEHLRKTADLLETASARLAQVIETNT